MMEKITGRDLLPGTEDSELAAESPLARCGEEQKSSSREQETFTSLPDVTARVLYRFSVGISATQ